MQTINLATLEKQNDILNTVKTFSRIQIFEEDGTFIVPSGITQIFVTACGGGGAGPGLMDAGGGGGAAIFRRRFTVTPEELISITVGKGGVKANNSYTGNNGTATIIGSLITLSGGGGGTHSSSKPVVGGAGGAGGGAGGSSSKNIQAQNGICGLYGGQGKIFSLDNMPFSPSVLGGNNGTWGGGGGAFNSTSGGGSLGPGGFGSTILGTNGGDGIVIIEW